MLLKNRVLPDKREKVTGIPQINIDGITYGLHEGNNWLPCEICSIGLSTKGVIYSEGRRICSCCLNCFKDPNNHNTISQYHK